MDRAAQRRAIHYAPRMPELPEVETTRRGLQPHLLGARIVDVDVRQPQLRWPVPADLAAHLRGQQVLALRRRSKYLLIDVAAGSALVHLGMSGSLRLDAVNDPRRTHDHLQLSLDSGLLLRYNDPRRFGSWLWQPAGQSHPLLANLGPEPFADEFDGARMWRLSRGRRAAVKVFLMDAATVVGVGNIYASEALFRAGIDPRRAAGRISQARYCRLAEVVREVLAEAINQGGTTLRDFLRPEGVPGYFAQSLRVYDRHGQACRQCGEPIRRVVLGQRASYYCPTCQR